MKKILFLTGIVALLSTTGCLVSDGGRGGYSHGRGHYERHADVIVGPPVVEVSVPVVEVRPPMVIMH